MLILHRKQDQVIDIGGEIEIVVISVSRDSVRLGIRAPKNVPVLRKELIKDLSNRNKLLAAALPQDEDELRKVFDALKDEMNSADKENGCEDASAVGKEAGKT